MMRRVGFLAVVFAFALALLPPMAVLAADAPSPSPPLDRVYALVGTWTCKSSDGASIVTQTGTRVGDDVDVVRRVRPYRGAPYALRDHFAHDPNGTWHVDIDAEGPNVIHALAPAWPKANRDWDAIGRDATGTRERLHFHVQGDTLDRTVLQEYPPAPGGWLTGREETCARGDAPPTPIPDCAVPNVKAHMVSAVPPSARDVPRGLTGTVQIMIALDENSQIESAAIISSPSAILSRPALEAARASKFQTEIRWCRPLAAKYVFTVEFR